MKKKYQIRFIRWWQSKSFKDGVSFTGWYNENASTGITAHAIVIFDEKFSTCPEREPVIMVSKTIIGSTIATMKKREHIAYCKKVERALIAEATLYKNCLEQAGFWVRKYTLNGFSKSPLK